MGFDGNVGGMPIGRNHQVEKWLLVGERGMSRMGMLGEGGRSVVVLEGDRHDVVVVGLEEVERDMFGRYKTSLLFVTVVKKERVEPRLITMI